MAEDEPDIRTPYDCGIGEQAVNRTRRLGDQLDSVQRVLAVLADWMLKDDGSAPVQFVHHRRDPGIAKIDVVIVRHHGDPVHVQSIEAVLNFAQTTFHVRQGQSCEQPQAPWIVPHQLCGIFIRFARQLAGQRDVAIPDSRPE